ncbi:MAG: iron-sulfur cluster assembly accessory protein [Zetaproteobacteria bacterium]|nr:iron-sulfur cluster assembly accessory protein [Zetaproteobacteria bacterium]
MSDLAGPGASQEEVVVFTARAMDAVHRYQNEKEEWAKLPVRVYIAGKICSGFTYGVSFDAAADGDLKLARPEWKGFEVVMDQDTYEYVQGSTVDWVDDERGTGFLIDNPRQKKFRGKFFNRKQPPA